MRKVCPACKRELDVEAFQVDPHDLLGANILCKKCHSKKKRAEWLEKQERLNKRPPHSKDAAKKKCPFCHCWVFVEPGTSLDICYSCEGIFSVTITTGDGTQPDNAHGIRLRQYGVKKRTRGK